jgi:branched-chain amino acid aminotransferase
MTREELTEALYGVIQANNMQSGVHTRLMVTRGVKETPSQDPRLTITGPTVVIIAEYKQANPEVGENGIKLHTSAVRRGRPDTLDPKLNCHSKLHEVIALLQALEAGADEALMLDVNGFVSTCNSTNFFMVRQGQVWTSTGQYCLNGVTRGTVIKLCRENDIAVREKDFSLADVYDADEAFVTGTFGALTPVVEVDGRTIGDGHAGAFTRKLSELYKRAIEAAIETEQARRAQKDS